MKDENSEKRPWEAKFDTMDPERFDNMPRDYYSVPLSYVEEGWSLLDAGCATANIHKYIEGKNISYVGMDFCQQLLDSARERHPEAELKLGSVLDIPFPDNSFDAVICKSVLEHIHPDEVKHAVAELVRVARHMVILVFHKFPDETATETHSIIYHGYWENTFSKDGLLSLLKDTGAFHSVEFRQVKVRMVWAVRLHG